MKNDLRSFGQNQTGSSRIRRLSPIALLPIALATASLGFGFLQDEKPKTDKDFVVPEFPGAAPNPQQEMIKAFQKVETELETMSLLLLEASKGDTTRLQNLDGSGIEDLLRMAESRPQGDPSTALAELLYASSAGGSKVLEGIDEIIKIAESNGNPNGL